MDEEDKFPNLKQAFQTLEATCKICEQNYKKEQSGE
jgi:hypothetical protein